MVTEIAILDIKAGMSESFVEAFSRAQGIISSMRGYIGHSLGRCVEKDDRFLLRVEWESLEDHTEGFRNSKEYGDWKALLHHFYDPFPTVEHYESVEMS